MKNKSTRISLFVLILLLVSCAKNKCDNGEQDKKETGIDCGGACEPCATDPIAYPENGSYGLNILYDSIDTCAINTNYSLCADISLGQSLKIVFTNNSTAPLSAVWFYVLGSEQNFSATSYNESTFTQEFTSTSTGHLDLNMEFGSMEPGANGIANIKVYENNSTTVTWEKNIYWFY